MRTLQKAIKDLVRAHKELVGEALEVRALEIATESDCGEPLTVVETDCGYAVVAETKEGDIAHLREEIGDSKTPPKKTWEKVFGGRKRNRSPRQSSSGVSEGDEAE